MTRWPCGTPSAETVAAARALQREIDVARGPDQPNNLVDEDARMQGHLAEALLDRWLTLNGVEHHWDGGLNDNPDFVVKGTKVAVRTTATRRNEFSDDYPIYIFERQAHGPSARFFIGIDKRSDPATYYLLGGTTLNEFLSVAHRLEVGDELMRGFVARQPMHVATVGMLTPPREWIEAL